jgi:ectoine hydroxylase-related dioxygenase (phytanoyl-CoA dioxygenase family)
LLYQEQELILVRRGELEGRLMADTGSPLEAHTVKGAGSKGGFGGANKSKKSSKSSKAPNKAGMTAQAKGLAKVLREEGVVRLDHVLTDQTADALRTHLYDMRREAEALVAAGEIRPIQRFANVLLRSNRCDMPVPLGQSLIVDQALVELLVQSPLGAVIAKLLTPQAVLYELSCLMSDPGSQRQVVHPDTPNEDDKEPVLYTCFVALQDVTIDMGPTTWLPRTHTAAVHSQFKDEARKDALLGTTPSKLGLLPKGSCGLYDSRLLHCGGANKSADRSRALFYFSFRNPTVTNPGNPGSIRRDMIDQWTLSRLQDELQCIAKGKQVMISEVA